MAIEIPGYKLLKTLGRGGMATVFLAEQKILERRVALKVMSRSLAQDPAFGKRFVREAKIVSQLVHPNIVNVHDVGNYKGLYYLSMQYVDGKDLKAMRGFLSVKQKLQAVRDIAKALDYAGGKGYVHRDIKPENILLDGNDNRAILTDFGIAKAVNNDMAMTQTGTAIGTPHYMSPEQAKGLEVDHRADIYSLGVVFYLLLTGSLPYDAESAVAIGIKHITEPVPLLPPALSQLQHIIDKMMAKRVVERFQSASDVVFALDEIDFEALEHTIELAKQMGQTFTESDYESDTAVVTSVDGESVDATAPREGGLSFAEANAERPQEIAQSFTIVYSADDIQEKNHRFVWLIIGLIALAITVGAVFKYYPHKVNAALASIGFKALLPTAHMRGLSENDRPLVGRSASQEPANVIVDASLTTQINDVKRQIAQINDDFSRNPARLSDLVTAYRRLIDLHPSSPDAKKALFDVLTVSQARAFQLAKKGEGKAAFELAAVINVLFPEVQKTQLAYLDSRIEQLLFIQKKMLKIEALMRKKVLSNSVIKQLLNNFNEVFAIDQNHTEALASQSQFVVRLLEQGEASYVKKRYKQAYDYSQIALQADADSTAALAFSQKVNRVLKGDDAVNLLLKRAKTASKNAHYYHPRTGSAYSYYKQVLNIDSGNKEAKKGLASIYNAFKKQIQALIKSEEFVSAKTRIEFAQKSASQSRELARFSGKWLPALDKKITNSVPKIESLILSATPIDSLNSKHSTELVPSKKIYTLFRYSGLAKTVTQLDVKLYFSARRILIDQTAVRLEQKNGQSQFILQSPSDVFEPGDYELVVFESDTVVTTMRFNVVKEALL